MSRCEIKVDRLSILDLPLQGSIYIRYYVLLGGGRRIQIDTREIAATANPTWDETVTIECRETSPDAARLVLEAHGVEFELRWRATATAKAKASVFGRLGGSKLLGKAEVSWKDVLAAPGLSFRRSLRFGRLSSELGGAEAPSLLVEMKVEGVGSSVKRQSGRRREEERGCRRYEWFGSEEDVLLAAATLNAS